MGKILNDLWTDYLKDLLKDGLKWLLGVLPGGIVSFITDNKALITVIILLGFTVVYATRLKLAAKSIGIIDIYDPKTLSTAKALKKAESSCDFLGVSAKSTADNVEVATQFERLSNSNSKHKIRFLLMNPDAEDNIKKRAGDEKVNPQAWPSDMQAAIINLKTLTNKKGIDIEIRLYDSYPLWRMVIIDNKSVYLNYALPARKINSSHLIKLDQSESSLANTFIKLYENMWESSIAVEGWLKAHQINI